MNHIQITFVRYFTIWNVVMHHIVVFGRFSPLSLTFGAYVFAIALVFIFAHHLNVSPVIFGMAKFFLSVSQSINVCSHKIGSTSHKKDHIRMDPNEWHALNHCHTLRNSMLHRHQPRNRCILQILHIYECIHCHWVVAFARATDRSVINWFAMHTTHSFAHSLNRTISRWEMFVVFIFIFIFHVWCLIILNMIYIEIV